MNNKIFLGINIGRINIGRINIGRLKAAGRFAAAAGVFLIAGSLAACSSSTKSTVSATTAAKETTQATTDTSRSDEELERTRYVRLEVVNKGEGIQVRILDENGDRITGMEFTVCVVPSGTSSVLDKEQSATIEGKEYTSDNLEGYVDIATMESGNCEIYLRPMPGYLDATPIPLSFIIYTYDENITDKIKQSSDVDVSKEDKFYVESSNDETTNKTSSIRESESAIKVSNMISSSFILGTSEKFEVTVPDYNEDDEITYVKINSKEVDSSLINLSDYIKESNKEELIIGDSKYTGYVYEKKKFDERLDEQYVSAAIIKDDESDTYMLYNLLPHTTTSMEDIYVGWYSKKGKHYYNNEDGYPVTGWNRIDGMWYYFDENGQKASVTGVDVSQYQEDIDWQALKDSGIDFAMIRCGFRGYETGVLVEDEKFEQNIQAAKEVGMTFGVYIFSQAINAAEAAEEASMIVQLSEKYGPDLPLAIDIEACSGRQDALTNAQRTNVINVFCSVVGSKGMEPMLYSNKSWLNNQINMDDISCKIWYAMWPGVSETDAPNDDALEPDPDMVPDRECEIWQYSDKGVVDGIEPLVDLNAWVPSLITQ